RITGGCVSATLTEVVQLDVLPESSVTLKVTGVVPSPKCAGALWVGLSEGSHASLAETEAKNAASWGSVWSIPLLPVHSTVTGAGQVIEGGVVSFTVTLNVHWDWFPTASFAVQVSGVVPSAKVLPEAGLHDTSGSWSQSSVAVAVKLAAAPAGLVHSTAWSSGQATSGGFVS